MFIDSMHLFTDDDDDVAMRKVNVATQFAVVLATFTLLSPFLC